MEKICLIGCGKIGGLHAKNLSGAADLFFCSRSRDSAERFNTAFQGKGVFPRFDEALADADIAAVVIASPPEFHKEQVFRSLKAGKAVLVEKPMCVSREEVDEIEGVLREVPDSLLMVAENYYYKPSLARIQQIVQDGSVGKVESVSVQKLFTQEASGWKRRYGALLEGGIHFVALISDLFQEAPQKVTAEFPDRSEGEAERHSITRLEYREGARAELNYSWKTKSLTKGIGQHSQILGSRGRILFESNGIYVFLNGKGKVGLSFPDLKDLMGYRRMTQDFLRCLEDRSRRPYSDFTRAKRDLQVVFEAYTYL